MSDIDPKHIDALAVTFESVVVEVGRYVQNIGTSAAQEAAREILSSTDPAVHAAMLDALTRHGVLREVTTHGPVWAERPRTATDPGLVLDDSPVRYVAGWQLMRRLVTEWEQA